MPKKPLCCMVRDRVKGVIGVVRYSMMEAKETATAQALHKRKEV